MMYQARRHVSDVLQYVKGANCPWAPVFPSVFMSEQVNTCLTQSLLLHCHSHCKNIHVCLYIARRHVSDVLQNVKGTNCPWTSVFPSVFMSEHLPCTSFRSLHCLGKHQKRLQMQGISYHLINPIIPVLTQVCQEMECVYSIQLL